MPYVPEGATWNTNEYTRVLQESRLFHTEALFLAASLILSSSSDHVDIPQLFPRNMWETASSWFDGWGRRLGVGWIVTRLVWKRESYRVGTGFTFIDTATLPHSSILLCHKCHRQRGACPTNLHYLVRIGDTRNDIFYRLHSRPDAHRADSVSMSVSPYRILLNK
jgi:hypothetical protein